MKYLEYFDYDPEEQNEDGTRHYTCTLCGFKNNGKAVKADACRKHIANLHKSVLQSKLILINCN